MRLMASPRNRVPHHVLNAASVARARQTHTLVMQGVAARSLRLAALLARRPHVVLQAVITPEAQTTDAQIIQAVACPWLTIVDLLCRNPDLVYTLHWRKWEEVIATAYEEQGFDVVLTPRSNDRGRDIIASSRGLGCIRYFDQIKAYRAGHLVTANDVRALVGVLNLDGNVSKGIVTTTSNFAPGIFSDENIQRLMPFRLELRPRDALLEWLRIAASASKANR